MDRSTYEKLSIRDSARSLKKYGSTSSKNTTKNESYIKHFVTEGETLQGISLKYDVTIEQIRRANRLYASDSLYLKEYLLIPVPICTSPTNVESNSAPKQVLSPTQAQNSFDNEDSIDDFLGKIDASIASTKEEVKKSQSTSEFAGSLDCDLDRRRPVVSRMKKVVNNNAFSDIYSPPQTMVVTQGKKVTTSLKRHEQQQDEIFQL